MAFQSREIPVPRRHVFGQLRKLLLNIGLALLYLVQVGLHLVPGGCGISIGLVRVVNLLLQGFQLLLGSGAVLGRLLDLHASGRKLFLNVGGGRLGPFHFVLQRRQTGLLSASS